MASRVAKNDRHAVGVKHLRRVDRVLRDVIDEVGPCSLRPQRDRFGMRAAPGCSCAAADDLAVPDDQAADIGVWGGTAAGGFAQPRRFEHEAPVAQSAYSMPSSFWSF